MKILKEFFFLNLIQFENIGIYFPLGVFLILACAVACCSVIFFTYHKIYTRLIYKKLLRHNAVGEENAKTLRELKIDDSFAIRSLLSRPNGQLTYIVKRAGEEKISYEEYMQKSKKVEEKIDFSTAGFYIPGDKTDMAKKLLEGSEPSWIKAAIVCVFFIGLLVLAVFTAYDLLYWINGLLKK